MNDKLDQLLAETAKSSLRLRFTGDLEVHYRNNRRRQLRIIRTALLVSIALGFALAPFMEVTVFRTPPEMLGSMILFTQTVTPVSLMAALLTWFSGPRLLTVSFQTAAVISTFASILALRYMALITEFQYSEGMLGTAAIAVAIFGSFGWYRMLSAFVLFFGIGISLEFRYAGPEDTPILSTYVLAFSFTIAVLGSLANEVLSRQSWLQRSLATALSMTDVLTGLSNRADFERRFGVALNQARREKRMVAVLLLDLDHFKRINDRHGHAAGDRALRAVADALVRSSAHRPLDVRARNGGEEFVVVWYDVSVQALPGLVNKVMEALRSIRLDIQKLGEPLRLTASAGACWTVPGESTLAQDLVQCADALMYRAKNAGRDRVFLEPYAPPA